MWSGLIVVSVLREFIFFQGVLQTLYPCNIFCFSGGSFPPFYLLNILMRSSPARSRKSIRIHRNFYMKCCEFCSFFQIVTNAPTFDRLVKLSCNSCKHFKDEKKRTTLDTSIQTAYYDLQVIDWWMQLRQGMHKPHRKDINSLHAGSMQNLEGTECSHPPKQQRNSCTSSLGYR